MKTSKLVNVLGIVMAATLALTGCGGNKDSTGDSETAKDNEKSTKTEISWMTPLHTPTPPSGDVQSKIEEYTGMKLDINWYPDASKDEIIQSSLASGTLADIVFMGGPTVRKALSSGMFWDVEPYLKDYPNLSQITEDRIDAARINGHVYGVPVQQPIARYGVLVRKDWLDNLNLEVPHTLDDLREVARAFTEDDPDGNGKDDTVGFVDRKESVSVGFRMLAGYFGAGNKFDLVDGQIIPAFMQDEYKEAMEWYKDIYQNGWMNSDFVVMPKNDQKDYIVQGKGGIAVTGLYDGYNFKSAAEGTDQADVMEWAYINDITYKDVPRRILSDTDNGMGGWFAISKDYVKTEADLKVVLKFIDDLMSDDMAILMSEGIEGVHYQINEDEEYVRIDEKKWTQEVQPYNSARISRLNDSIIKRDNPLVNEGNEKIAENEEYAVLNPAQSLSSETYDKEWSALVEPVEDAYVKFIMDEIDMDGYDKVVQTFLDQGGQTIIDEFTDNYNELNK